MLTCLVWIFLPSFCTAWAKEEFCVTTARFWRKFFPLFEIFFIFLDSGNVCRNYQTRNSFMKWQRPCVKCLSRSRLNEGGLQYNVFHADCTELWFILALLRPRALRRWRSFWRRRGSRSPGIHIRSHIFFKKNLCYEHNRICLGWLPFTSTNGDRVFEKNRSGSFLHVKDPSVCSYVHFELYHFLYAYKYESLSR